MPARASAGKQPYRGVLRFTYGYHIKVFIYLHGFCYVNHNSLYRKRNRRLPGKKLEKNTHAVDQ